MVFVGKMNCFDIYKGVDKKMGLLFDICKDGNILETLNSMDEVERYVKNHSYEKYYEDDCYIANKRESDFGNYYVLRKKDEFFMVFTSKNALKRYIHKQNIDVYYAKAA